MKKLALCSLLLACTNSFAGDLNHMSWTQIQTQAKQQGQLTFAVWYLQPAWREFVKSFEQETGIQVRIPEGTLDGNVNKLRAESRRAKGSIDVIALGANRLPAFAYQTILAPLDKLPEFRQLKTRSEGIESHGYAVTFWGNQTGLAYDPARLSEKELPQSFAQLEHYIHAHPKAFGMNDPNGGGAGQRFIEAVIRHISGPFKMSDQAEPKVIQSWSETWNWFRDNKKDMVFTASNADSLTRINDGEIVIAPAWEDHLAGLQKRGAISKRLQFYIPQFGMSGGGNFVAIPANAKHKAAAMVFVQWLTSAKTQSALNARFGVSPQRPDASAKHALVPASMRQNATEPFSSSYSIELKKRFTRNVLMH